MSARDIARAHRKTQLGDVGLEKRQLGFQERGDRSQHLKRIARAVCEPPRTHGHVRSQILKRAVNITRRCRHRQHGGRIDFVDPRLCALCGHLRDHQHIHIRGEFWSVDRRPRSLILGQRAAERHANALPSGPRLRGRELHRKCAELRLLTIHVHFKDADAASISFEQGSQ